MSVGADLVGKLVLWGIGLIGATIAGGIGIKKHFDKQKLYKEEYKYMLKEIFTGENSDFKLFIGAKGIEDTSGSED